MKRSPKNFYIDHDAQNKVLLFSAGMSFIVILSIGAICFNTVQAFRKISGIGIADTTRLAHIFYIEIGLALFLVGLIFTLSSVVLTHRLAGPIWRLREDLKKFFTSGEKPTINFRDTDAYRDLPELINKLLAGYKG